MQQHIQPGIAPEQLTAAHEAAGMAVDIRVPGRPLAAVRDAAKALEAGGVGFYPASNFVHVDVGRVRYW